MKNLMLVAALAGCCALATAEEPAMPDGAVVLENAHLRAVVTPVGARLISLRLAGSDVENIKVLPYVGGANEVRFGQVMNLNDLRDTYALALRREADGTQVLTATAQVTPTEDRPAVATVVKEYRLAPDASQLALSLELVNRGTDELALIPWLRHLLLRRLDEQPEETHQTTHGLYRRGNPIPGQPRLDPKFDWHHFPAANWTARVRPAGNTFATVLRPEDMLKLYNWHRVNEDFHTQEVIAAPLFVPPGERRRWSYSLVFTAPVAGVAYAAPDLVIGCTPFPTKLPAATPELTLHLVATRAVPGLTATARVVLANEPATVLAERTATLDLVANVPQPLALPVALPQAGHAQLILTFQQNGQPWHPGAAVGDQAPVLIPLVIGVPDAGQVVFPDRTARGARLRQVQPQTHTAPERYAGPDFAAYEFPASQRSFRQDTFTAAPATAPLRLFACAGEYESRQLVLVPRQTGEVAVQVAATPLTGPGGTLPAATVRQFLYATTRMPSGYNARYPVGEFPEALLPTAAVTLTGPGNTPLFFTWQVPRDAQPGTYTGSLRLTTASGAHDIPVELTVWHIALPLRHRWWDSPSSLKGTATGGPVMHNPDGTPMNPQQTLRAIVDKHLEYGLTPCDAGFASVPGSAGFLNDLLNLRFESFDAEMERYVAAGATKLFLGQIPALLKQHRERLPQVEAHLREKGWIDYFYVRPGFDEASIDLVPQIQAVCREWKALSQVPIMETYYHDQRAPELYGLLDIWARSPSDAPWIRERMAAGDRFWKVNSFPNDLEPEPWFFRRRCLGFWEARFTGTYIWTIKQWHNVARWGEDYWCDGGVGNLAAVLMWPHETGILATIRLEGQRDALEDTALFWLLREKVEALAGKTLSDPAAAAALATARELCATPRLSETVLGAADLDRLRQRAGDALSTLNAQR